MPRVINVRYVFLMIRSSRSLVATASARIADFRKLVAFEEEL